MYMGVILWDGIKSVAKSGAPHVYGGDPGGKLDGYEWILSAPHVYGGDP